MSNISYPVVLHEQDKGYWVEFPDLEGCLTEGETVDEALFMAEDALRTWYYGKDFLHVDNFEKPSSLETIKKKYPNELVYMVEYKDLA